MKRSFVFLKQKKKAQGQAEVGYTLKNFQGWRIKQQEKKPHENITWNAFLNAWLNTHYSFLNLFPTKGLI